MKPPLKMSTTLDYTSKFCEIISSRS